MKKTRIEWCDYTVNPVKGLCPVGCDYCYARRMYKRFHWDETIRVDVGAWHEGVDVDTLKTPSRIFVGSTMELFGPWLSAYHVARMIDVANRHPQHTFIFLTKRPQELARYNPWPHNCWVGASVTNADQQSAAYLGLGPTMATVKFISYEPLLSNVYMEPQFLEDAGIGWVIIGQQTPVRKLIPRERIDNITNAADAAGIPVFHKDNLGLPNPGREFPR